MEDGKFPKFRPSICAIYTKIAPFYSISEDFADIFLLFPLFFQKFYTFNYTIFSIFFNKETHCFLPILAHTLTRRSSGYGQEKRADKEDFVCSAKS